METYMQAKAAATYIEAQTQQVFETCIVLGSGASGLLDAFELHERLPFKSIPHLVRSTYLEGEFISASISGQLVLILHGRLHYYEGYTAQEITFPIRILKLLGIRQLIMTNASGGLNPNYKAGEIVLIKDHINLMPDHPLRGANEERFGLRFPDMSQAYDEGLRVQLRSAFVELYGESIKEGVYVGLQGPSLETPAEYKYLHIIGGDMVGMSTVPEVIVANHCQIKTAVLSIVTNVCYPPEAITETTLEEVIAIAEAATPKLQEILAKFVGN